MADYPGHIAPARVLLFERDPLKRHYFEKYVLGILWHGLTEEEKQQRVLEAVRRRAQSSEVICK